MKITAVAFGYYYHRTAWVDANWSRMLTAHDTNEPTILNSDLFHGTFNILIDSVTSEDIEIDDLQFVPLNDDLFRIMAHDVGVARGNLYADGSDFLYLGNYIHPLYRIISINGHDVTNGSLYYAGSPDSTFSPLSPIERHSFEILAEEDVETTTGAVEGQEIIVVVEWNEDIADVDVDITADVVCNGVPQNPNIINISPQFSVRVHPGPTEVDFGRRIFDVELAITSDIQTPNYLYISRDFDVELAITSDVTIDVHGEQSFDTYGDHTFTIPGGVTSITVECWGAGGGGGASTTGPDVSGAGGGGGGYARSVLVVTPGTNFNLYVAYPTLQGTDGEATTFDGGTVQADGGLTPTGIGGGLGGNGTGDVTYSGGQGGDGDTTSARAGGGGGGAGSTGNGGTGTNGASGGSGGTGTSVDGGNGGNGPLLGPGNGGNAYGGGGAGGAGNGIAQDGGAGGAGKVKITW